MLRGDKIYQKVSTIIENHVIMLYNKNTKSMKGDVTMSFCSKCGNELAEGKANVKQMATGESESVAFENFAEYFLGK